MIPTLLIMVTVTTSGPTSAHKIDANSSNVMTKVTTDPATCEAAGSAMRARPRTGIKMFAYCEAVPQ